MAATAAVVVEAMVTAVVVTAVMVTAMVTAIWDGSDGSRGGGRNVDSGGRKRLSRIEIKTG